MKSVFAIVVSVAMSFAANAADVQSVVSSELVNIETQKDYCRIAISINKLIQLGEPAVDALSEAVISPKTGWQTKWSAAQALGEIGSDKALPALNAALRGDNGWLRDIAKRSISAINGETPRIGKVYVMSFGAQATKTDCEAGTVEIVK